MYTKEALNRLYTQLGQSIDISDELFDKAVAEYNALGKWIDEATPNYSISIYPQGSFALGTVIKPITDKDDYDLDLVCEFAKQYDLTARQLKRDVVKPLLVKYRRISGEIEEKRRCWHVEYDEVPNFHMDIIPAVNRASYVDITDHDEDRDFYEYIGSNPAGYTEWFFSRSAKTRSAMYERYLSESRMVVAQADVEKVKRLKIKTPLQRAIQLLKRHRDIMFEHRDQHDKPVSVIITTIAAQLYQNEDNVIDTLANFLNGAENYIYQNKRDGLFYIENPAYSGDNFANKWNETPARAETFFEWLNKAKLDLIDMRLLSYTRIQMAANMSNVIGAAPTKLAFAALAKEDELSITQEKIKVETKTGMLSDRGTVSVPPNRHYGK